MTLYLVRHAHAGDRSTWDGHDRGRPLSEKGESQAVALMDRYRNRPITRVLSGPAVRCRQTVAPLAGQQGLEVAICAPLDEGSPPDEGIALLRSLAAEDVVLCSHGDVIPEILAVLVGQGMLLDGKSSPSKAGTYEIRTDGHILVAACYVDPPAKVVAG